MESDEIEARLERLQLLRSSSSRWGKIGDASPVEGKTMELSILRFDNIKTLMLLANDCDKIAGNGIVGAGTTRSETLDDMEVATKEKLRL